MTEFFRRLIQQPVLSLELLVITFAINLLGLASPIFVMLVLGRYIGFGVDATLATLVIGVVIAIFAEFVFRTIRLKYAQALVAGIHTEAAQTTFDVLTNGDFAQISDMTPRLRNEVARDLEQTVSTYSAPNLCACLDVPFGALFIFVLYFISAELSLIALIFIVLAVGLRLVFVRLNFSKTKELTSDIRNNAGLIESVLGAGESARVFDGGRNLAQKWSTSERLTSNIRSSAANLQGNLEALSLTVQALMSAAIISVGAMLAVAGDLSVSQLIGGNIFAARALSPIVRFSSLLSAFSKAHFALSRLRSLIAVPIENHSHSGRKIQSNTVEFRDVSFGYGNSISLLFEALSLKVERGSILLVDGSNGVGKSSLLRLVMGLLNPQKGQVLVDGIDLRQLAIRDWRKQIAYVPQEPQFFNVSIRENLLLAAPEASDDDLFTAIETGGMQSFVDTAAGGLDFVIERNGENLSLGIKKRLALSRAVIGEKSMAIFDEPTEGLDEEGRGYFYNVLNEMSNSGTTIIIVSSDEHIRKGAREVLSLNDYASSTPSNGRNGSNDDG